VVELDCAGQEIPFGREEGIHLTGEPHGWKTELENRRGGRGSADGGTQPPREGGRTGAPSRRKGTAGGGAGGH